MTTMVKKLRDKLTKPATPKTVDEMLAAGGRIVFHVPVTDEKGRALSQEEVKELHAKSARMQIASYEKIVGDAAGLRPLAIVEDDLATRRAESERAVKHWQLMQRRYFGGMAEMPEVEQARREYSVAQSAYRPVLDEHSKLKAAETALAEIERIRKEIQ